MTWTSRYHPPLAANWQGRADAPRASCFFQITKLVDLRKPLPTIDKPIAFAFLGFCCDEGVKRNLGRPGAAEGPRAIREILAKLPIQKKDLLCFDVGDITCEDGNLEAAQAALASVVALLLQAHITPIVFGGGHELAFGHYQGIVQHFPEGHLCIVNFDAHFDMRALPENGQGTSGTPFLQIAEREHQRQKRFDYNCIGIQQAGNTRVLFETAKSNRASVILADDLQLGYMDKCVNFVDRIIDENQMIYVSLCLDVLGVPYAPGVSAPQALGLSPWQVIPFIRQLASSAKVVSYDVAELAPRLDIDNRTAKAAANFIFEIIHHHAPHVGNKHAANAKG